MHQKNVKFQNTLIDKIVRFANDPVNYNNANGTELIAAIPELSKIADLLDAAASAHDNTLMALAGTWDKSDAGFTATRDSIAGAYHEFTGISLPETVDSEEEDVLDDVPY